MMKNKYTVDVAVTIFLQKEVTAGDEGEANQMAEDGISLSDVTKAYNNGECEIEIIGSEVEEEDIANVEDVDEAILYPLR
jgi:hypothetical protein